MFQGQYFGVSKPNLLSSSSSLVVIDRTQQYSKVGNAAYVGKIVKTFTCRRP